MDSQLAVICVCAAWPLVPTVAWLQFSYLWMYHCSVADSHLLPLEHDPSQRVSVRGGGAIRIAAGSLFIDGGSFTRCSAGPRDSDFDSCALSFSASAGLCTDGLGGAISGERANIEGQTPPAGCVEPAISHAQQRSATAHPLWARLSPCAVICVNALPTQWPELCSPTRERQSATIAARPLLRSSL
jgi:hypothetical protein